MTRCVQDGVEDDSNCCMSAERKDFCKSGNNYSFIQLSESMVALSI